MVGFGQYSSSLRGARPWSRLFGAEIRTSHPSGSRCRSREPAPAPLAQSCAPRKSSVPGRVQGLRTAEVSYPEERGASTSWLATWAHLRQRAQRRGAGAQSSRDGLIQALVRAPCCPAEINQRLARAGTALGRALRRSRLGPFCGLPPAGRRAGWCEPFFVRSTSWPAARTGWRSVRPR